MSIRCLYMCVGGIEPVGSAEISGAAVWALFNWKIGNFELKPEIKTENGHFINNW